VPPTELRVGAYAASTAVTGLAARGCAVWPRPAAGFASVTPAFALAAKTPALPAALSFPPDLAYIYALFSLSWKAASS